MIRRLLFLVLFLLPVHAFAQLAIVDAYFEDPDRRIVRNESLKAGETLYLSFRITGYRQDDSHHVKMNWFVDCMDPAGNLLAQTTTDKIESTLALEDRNWRPKVDWSLVIPTYAPTGEYKVKVRVRDELADKEVSRDMTFNVRGEDIEPSDTLAVRKLEYMDAEDGAPKPAPVYVRPSTLWAKFRIVGFKFGLNHQVAVEVDMSVLDSEGKVLFQRPKAAVDANKMFYPPRFLTEVFSLDIAANVKPAEYTIKLDVHDSIGDQTASYESKFTVQ